VLPDAQPSAFGGFVNESLGLLAQESPFHLQALAAALGHRRITIAIKGEPVQCLFPGPQPWVGSASEASEVTVETTIETLAGILDGDDLLARALIDDRLIIRGSCDDVLAVDDALRAWGHGALRSPSFSLLCERFKSHYAGAKHARVEFKW